MKCVGGPYPAAAKLRAISSPIRSDSPAATRAMMQPPKPPPVIRAPRAPEARAISTARSTCGTVISKSSRMDSCEASRSGARSAMRPARSTSTASSTRAFSVTTWRTRRRITGSESCSSAASEIGDVAQRRHAEQPGGLLAAGSAGCVLAVDQRMRSLGVQDQDFQAGAARVEPNLLGRVGPAVEEQRMAGGAQGRGGLVHQAGRGPDEDVLGAPGQLGSLQTGDLEVVEVGQSSEHGALQSGRGGQAGAFRHVGCQHQIGSTNPMPGLLEGPHHARDVRLPTCHSRLQVGGTEDLRSSHC